MMERITNPSDLPADSDAQIIGILGDRGSGKTCLMVAVSYHEWMRSGRKLRVVANFKLRGIPSEPFPLLPPPYPKEPINDYKIRILNIFAKYAGSLLLIDEAHGIFESRGSGGSKEGVALTFTLSQIRKLRINLLWNAQMSGTVDLRMRGLSDCLLVCVKPKQSADMTYAHVWRRNEMNAWRKTTDYIEIYRPPYHDLYNSDELVRPSLRASDTAGDSQPFEDETKPFEDETKPFENEAKPIEVKKEIEFPGLLPEISYPAPQQKTEAPAPEAKSEYITKNGRRYKAAIFREREGEK